MAEPASSINYVTVLRDPVQHWLSYYYFYFQPEMKVAAGMPIKIRCACPYEPYCPVR